MAAVTGRPKKAPEAMRERAIRCRSESVDEFVAIDLFDRDHRAKGTEQSATPDGRL